MNNQNSHCEEPATASMAGDEAISKTRLLRQDLVRCLAMTAKLFLFLLIVWALGEIATRLFIPFDPERRSLDRSEDAPYIRTDWVPGFERDYVIEGLAGQTGTMHFKINEFGFRSSSMKTAKKPEGTRRIFFLGGSVTEELYLPDEKTFPFLTEKKLSESFPDKKFECVNNGISGYLAADVLALLLYKILYYEPDLVVVMLANNDLRYGTVPHYDPVRRPGYRKALYTPDHDEGIGKDVAKVLKRSHFLTLLKWRLFNRIFPPDAEKYKTPLEQFEAWRAERLKRPFTPVSESKSLDDFLKYLEEIIFIARGHGVRLIFMTEPYVYQENLPPEINEKLWSGWLGAGSHMKVNLSPEFLLKESRRFNDAVRELSEKQGVELIDLEREIPKDLGYFADDLHLTPKGAGLASRVITAYLIEHPEGLSP